MDTCFTPNNNNNDYSEGFADGLGKVYSYVTYSSGPWASIIKSLQFYKKGSDSCGTRITTGIESPQISNLKVYPNPASGFINISLPENHTAATFEIFNINGELMMTKEISSAQQVDINDLPPGMYFYKVMLNDQQFVGKLVVQR